MSPISVGQLIEVTTERLAYGGEAVARHHGLTIFVRGAAADERVRIRITEKKKHFARAVVDSILAASPDRREPPCRYFGECGGCQLQHITYEAQLEAKAGFVRDALTRIGRIDWPHQIEVRSASEWGYRSRAQLKAERRHGSTAVGFFKAASQQVCDIDQCPILLPELNQGLQNLRAFLKNTPARFSHPHLEIDIASSHEGMAVEPSTVRDALEREAADTHYSATAHRKVNGFDFQFSPTSFFQVNERLIDDFVRSAVEGESGELAIDLYAGVGLFTLPLSRNFRKVYGVESHPLSVRFAQRNLKENGVENISFFQETVQEWLEEYLNYSGRLRPDLLLLDPPRTGAADAIDLIARLDPERITYVSCDPATLARDLRALLDHDYNLKGVVTFDFFPQTYHVETIATVEKRK